MKAVFEGPVGWGHQAHPTGKALCSSLSQHDVCGCLKILFPYINFLSFIRNELKALPII
jgi:hypothetical protein